MAALNSGDGALRSEAAVAMGQIAHREKSGLSEAAINSLGEAVGREVLRIAVVIDSDKERGASITAALSGGGMLAHHWDSGARGVALLHRVPGVDVIVLADTLGDLTAAQVLEEIAADDRTASTATASAAHAASAHRRLGRQLRLASRRYCAGARALAFSQDP